MASADDGIPDTVYDLVCEEISIDTSDVICDGIVYEKLKVDLDLDKSSKDESVRGGRPKRKVTRVKYFTELKNSKNNKYRRKESKDSNVVMVTKEDHCKYSDKDNLKNKFITIIGLEDANKDKNGAILRSSEEGGLKDIIDISIQGGEATNVRAIPKQRTTKLSKDTSVHKKGDIKVKKFAKDKKCAVKEIEFQDIQKRKIMKSPQKEQGLDLIRKLVEDDTEPFSQHSLFHHQYFKQPEQNAKHECCVCFKAFKGYHLLISHFKRHTGAKIFKCPRCDKSFIKKSFLQSHLSDHPPAKPHACPVCPKSFVKPSSLNMHVRLHTEFKPYKCDECGKNFISSGKLRSHMRSHSAEKQFQCEVCDQQFKQEFSLKEHLLIHTGEKPHVCHYCGKRFRHISTLHQHNRIHNGKRYKCDVCLKQFAHNSTLYKHKRIHTGEKPYECDVCERTFSRHSNLNVHKETHFDRERYFQCKMCDMKYTTNSSLSKHMRTKHS